MERPTLIVLANLIKRNTGIRFLICSHTQSLAERTLSSHCIIVRAPSPTIESCENDSERTLFTLTGNDFEAVLFLRKFMRSFPDSATQIPQWCTRHVPEFLDFLFSTDENEDVLGRAQTFYNDMRVGDTVPKNVLFDVLSHQILQRTMNTPLYGKSIRLLISFEHGFLKGNFEEMSFTSLCLRLHHLAISN